MYSQLDTINTFTW